MGWRGRLRPLVRLSVPIIIANVGNQAMSLVDTAMAGRIDDLALGAVGLGSSLFFMFASLGMGVAMGVDPLASQAFGAGRFRQARHAMWQGLYAGSIAAVPVGAAVVITGFLLETFGVSPELAAKTREYNHTRLLSLLPFIWFTVQRSYLQAAHRTRPIVVAVIVANVVNLFADWLFMFGDQGLQRLGLPPIGLPALGVAGIGFATTLSRLLQLTIIALALRSIDSGRGPRPLHHVDRKMLRRVFALGIPISLQIFSEAGVFSLAALMAGLMGTLSLAAHQVALMLAATTFMVPLSISMATSVQVGRAIGRGDSHEARSAGFLGMVLGGAVMMAAALSMWIFPNALARMMTPQPEVVSAAAQLIVIAGFFQLSDGIQAVASGALRGAGLTRWAMGANIVAYWVLGLPISIALGFWFDWGPQGIWWGLTLGLSLAAIALTARFIYVSRRPFEALHLD